MPWPRGKAHPPTRAKLTPAQVVEIRIRYADGEESMRQIAEAYGIGHDAVWNIVNSYTWRDLPGTWDPELRNYFNAGKDAAP